MHNPVGISVVHVLVGNHHVVFGSHVVGQIVVHNQPQQSVQQSQVHLLENLVEP